MRGYIIFVFFHSLLAKGLQDLINGRHIIEIVYSDICILNNVYDKGESKIHGVPGPGIRTGADTFLALKKKGTGTFLWFLKRLVRSF